MDLLYYTYNYTACTELLILEKTILVQTGSVLLLIFTICLRTGTRCPPLILIHNKSRSFLLIFTKSQKKEVGVHLDLIEIEFSGRTHSRMTETTPKKKEHLFVTLFHMMKGRGIFFQLCVYSESKTVCSVAFFFFDLVKCVSMCVCVCLFRTLCCLDTQ